LCCSSHSLLWSWQLPSQNLKPDLGGAVEREVAGVEVVTEVVTEDGEAGGEVAMEVTEEAGDAKEVDGAVSKPDLDL
jgi:hypothetical protein